MINTTSSMGNFVFHLFSALAEMGRDLISERTKDGLKAARIRGRKGRRPRIEEYKINKALKMYHTNKFTVKEIIDTTGISKSTWMKVALHRL